MALVVVATRRAGRGDKTRVPGETIQLVLKVKSRNRGKVYPAVGAKESSKFVAKESAK